jgi:hypothetical protein
MVAGVLGDRAWRGWQSTHWVANGNWRGSVAQYMALYTEQTLEGLDPSAATQAPQLARVGEQLGIAGRNPVADLRHKQARLALA